MGEDSKEKEDEFPVVKPLSAELGRRKIVLKGDFSPDGTYDTFPGQDRLKHSLDLFLSSGPRTSVGGDLFIQDNEGCFTTKELSGDITQGVTQWKSDLYDQLMLYHFENFNDEIGMIASIPKGKARTFVDGIEAMLESIVNDYRSRKKATESRQKGAIKRAMSAFEENIGTLSTKVKGKKASLTVKHPHFSQQVRLYLDNAQTDFTEHAIGGPKQKILGQKDSREQYEKYLDAFEATLKRHMEGKEIASPSLQKSGKRLVDKYVKDFLGQHEYLQEVMAGSNTALHKYFLGLRQQLPRDLYAITKDIATDFVLGEKAWDMVPEESRHLILRYRPSLFVDRSEQKSPLVKIVQDLSGEQISGSLRHKLKEQGGDSDENLTSHNYLKSGLSIHAADGVLIFRAEDVVDASATFAELLHEIERGSMRIVANQLYEGHAYSYSCPIEINPRFVIHGTQKDFDKIQEEIPGMNRHFTIKGVAYSTVKATESTINEMARRVRNEFHKLKSVPVVDNGALECILEEALRHGGDNETFTSDFSFIQNIVHRTIMDSGTQQVIERDHVETAIKKMRFEINRVEENRARAAKDGWYPIAFDKNEVGLVNVMFLEDKYVGDIGRGSAAVYAGLPSLAHIDELVGYTGIDSDKSMHSVEAFVRSELTRRNIPFPYSVALAYEQNGDMIDGDSAGMVFTMALLSALSGKELYGNIIGTGAIGTNGEIQAIGGLNEKIESYYSILKHVTDDFSKGTGAYKIVIPKTNVKDLMLNKETMHGLRSGKIEIYPVSNYSEAIPLFFVKPNGLFKTIEEKATKAKNLYLK